MTAKSSNVPNRLIKEKSPYLLQHAHNPVDWYPWGEEAFDRAKAEDKPIFLSIGYSTCHWCHVMERESFEDEEVASVLNQHFISIKVDREERPDIDHIYMTVCQALTGSGGWPLTIFMTPDKKPFYAGTYFPKKTKYGRIGLLELLNRLHSLWNEKREDVLKSSDQIMEAVQGSFFADTEGGGSADEFLVGMETVEEGFELLKRNFDRRYGGFGSAPKFPTPHNLLFLLRYHFKSNSEAALDMVSSTLEAMYRGGVYDHIGFGFSRYSTDNKWLVPHFEKMLYDNALLAMAYLECYHITKKPIMRTVAEQIFTYVLRDMTSPEGGFYSAEDADSEGVEGKFYVWTPDEVMELLGNERGREFCRLYDITEKGNFEGKSIPNLIHADNEELEKIPELDTARNLLFKAREKRVHPYKDDKILTSWNGLMIAALAMGGRILGTHSYTRAAEKAYEFIVNHLQRQDGRLLARYRDGEAGVLAYADDYAFMIWACIELYLTTYKAPYLQKAIELNKGLLEYFWDNKNGGLFLYGKDGEQLISRPKEIYDGAIPSANSQTIVNLMRLSRILGDESYAKQAESILKVFGDTINNHPMGYFNSLTGIMYAAGSSQEIVVVGDPRDDTVMAMVNVIRAKYNPFSVSVLYSVDKENEELERMIPGIVERKMHEGRPAAYVCRNFTCNAPVTTVDELKEQLSIQ
jgi:uncharacterized protein YyaL (SSP411 family)